MNPTPIGYLAIAALGLNILVGFTGQISIGHAAFFGFGAFTSAYLSTRFPIPVFFSIPLAGVVTGLTLYNGAVVAELLRSGVGSLPKGQTEAGLAIGALVGWRVRRDPA